MNNPLPSLPNHKKPDFLEPFKSVFFQYFEQLVNSCCMRIDLEFGLQIGKDREKISKEHYINLVEYLRSVRGDIKRDYLMKINRNFDRIGQKKESQLSEKINMPAIGLADDDFVKEDYTSTLIIRQCEQIYREDLIRLNQLIAVLLEKSAIVDRQNPVAPENLIRALFEVIKPLKLNSNHRVALYKTFEANVFSQLGLIYLELITHCETSIKKLKIVKGEVDTKPQLETAPEETVGIEFQQLQARLAQWRSNHAPSGYDPIPAEGDNFFEHFEIKNALQVLVQFSTTTAIHPETEKQPLKWQVTKKLEELNFSDETKTLAKSDEDVLDLVSLIFAGIAGSAYLSGSVKTTILQLEIPMSAACLGQYSVFLNPVNPVRQLLDEIFAAGLFLYPDNEANYIVLKRIAEITQRMIKGSGFDISGWSRINQEFAQFMVTQQQSIQLHEESLIEAMIDRETLSSEHKVVANLIENSMQGKALPATIIDFLQNAWQNVMLNDYLLKDQQPELWKKSVQTMNDLIVSVIPPAEDSGRKDILKLIPGMIKELRSGLKRITYDKKTKSRFFKELAVLHIIVMDKKGAKTTKTVAGKEKPAPDIKVELNAMVRNDPFSNQVNDLKMGDWVVFDLDTEKNWGKLARRGVNNENLLFVDKNGEKILQIEADALAERFRQGQATLAQLDDLPITESVLSELMDLHPLTHQ